MVERRSASLCYKYKAFIGSGWRMQREGRDKYVEDHVGSACGWMWGGEGICRDPCREYVECLYIEMTLDYFVQESDGAVRNGDACGAVCEEVHVDSRGHNTHMCM
jgi:hypothetical protein